MSARLPAAKAACFSTSARLRAYSSLFAVSKDDRVSLCLHQFILYPRMHFFFNFITELLLSAGHVIKDL